MKQLFVVVAVVSGSLFASAARADNLCSVLAAVRADAPKRFETIVDRSKPDGEHRFGSKQVPTDAIGAGVGYSSGAVESATWDARWQAKGTSADRLSALKKRVMACPFAKQLVGDGKPHATEKSSPPSAIDWTDPKAGAGVTFEILAEGAEGASISISVSPTK